MIAFYGTTLFQEHFVAVAVSEERAAPNATLESNSVLLRRRHSKSNTQYQRRGKTDAGCRARAILANFRRVPPEARAQPRSSDLTAQVWLLGFSWISRGGPTENNSRWLT
jgi:hypothetical protein